MGILCYNFIAVVVISDPHPDQLFNIVYLEFVVELFFFGKEDTSGHFWMLSTVYSV